MRENVRVKSVHFNIKNDQELIKSIGKKNFSRYVKELIKADVERKKELPKQPIKQSGGIHFKLK